MKSAAPAKGKTSPKSAAPQQSKAAPKNSTTTRTALTKRAQSVSTTVTKAMSVAMSKVGSQAKKAAKAAEETDFRGGARRVGGAIASATRNLTTKLHLTKGEAAKPSSKTSAKAPATKTPPRGAAPKPAPAAPRVTKRATDVALDDLAQNYTPGHTSLKSSFREGGVASTKDQEMSGGFSDDRWNDEDHYTNKSGDPRIGTHGRTYEPNESKSKK